MTTPPSPTPARRAAFEVLRRVFEGGAWADRALPAAAERHELDRRDRALAHRLAYGAVQRRGTTDHLIALLSSRAADDLDPPVAAALRLGLYELMFMDAVPDHAAVDQAVELAKGESPPYSRKREEQPDSRKRSSGRPRQGAAGFVNAVLRRAARERESLLAGLHDARPGDAAIAHSHPLWLAEMWWRELGAEPARALMAAGNEPAETVLRANTLRIEPDALAAGLREDGVAVGRPPPGPPLLAPPEAIVVEGAFDVAGSTRFAAGELTPQARGSMAVVEVLDPQPGERVLDLCAAPGTKTTQIAARMENRGELVAVDRDSGRCGQLRGMCERMAASCVAVVQADAGAADLGDGYDRVLVDAPCSDLGTLASRPDARWRKSPRLIERVAGEQRRILVRAAAALRPGGTLVYSTCTVSRRENEDQVAALEAAAGYGGTVPPLVVEDLGAASPALAASGDGRLLQLLPHRDGTDGFFIARLRRI